jgi:hypothetical protein
MLEIRTFDARHGGNVLYKALAHPLAAEAVAALYGRLAAAGPVAVFDPDDVIEALLALYPNVPKPCALYVQDAMAIGRVRAGMAGRSLTELPESGARSVLVAAFDAERIIARIRHLLPAGAEVLSLDAVRLPAAMLTNPRRTLDRLNFATNFCFFRDQGGLSTRLVTANYWAGHLGRGGAGGAGGGLDRQCGGAGAVRPAGIHRAAFYPRDRRRRARRGEIRARYFWHRRGCQPVLLARRQCLAVGPLRGTAGAGAWRAGLVVASEQPCRADSGRRGAARPHGGGAAGGVCARGAGLRDRGGRCGGVAA